MSYWFQDRIRCFWKLYSSKYFLVQTFKNVYSFTRLFLNCSKLLECDILIMTFFIWNSALAVNKKMKRMNLELQNLSTHWRTQMSEAKWKLQVLLYPLPEGLQWPFFSVCSKEEYCYKICIAQTLVIKKQKQTQTREMLHIRSALHVSPHAQLAH